jgi:hypothetical protein
MHSVLTIKDFDDLEVHYNYSKDTGGYADGSITLREDYLIDAIEFFGKPIELYLEQIQKSIKNVYMTTVTTLRKFDGIHRKYDFIIVGTKEKTINMMLPN